MCTFQVASSNHVATIFLTFASGGSLLAPTAAQCPVVHTTHARLLIAPFRGRGGINNEGCPQLNNSKNSRFTDLTDLAQISDRTCTISIPYIVTRAATSKTWGLAQLLYFFD